MNITANVKSFGKKAHEIREQAADSLESAADSARSAGKKLDSTAAFVRKTCIQERVLGSLRNSIRRSPMQSLAMAVAFGLVAGFTCRR